MSTNSDKTNSNYYAKANNAVLNNNYESAIEYYKKSLDLKKDELRCLHELGNLYEKLSKYSESIDCHKKIILLENDICKKIISLNQIGVCYSILKEFKNAIDYFEKVLQIKNDIPDVYNNIAFCYLELKNFKLCEVNYYNSLRIEKNNKVFWALGELYFYTKKYDISIKSYENVDDFQCNHTIQYNCSFPYLAQKKFKRGFELYENRIKFNNICRQTKLKQRLEIPQIEYWDGEKICNNLLIIYEQGIGDNIQYYRYIIELSYLYPSMKIHYFCTDSVRHIFKEYENIQIVQDVICTDYDYKIYIMSLPYILKIDKINPNLVNYIKVNEEKVKYWKNELNHLKKYKVGITYNGLLSYIICKNIPLSEFKILFDCNIDLICIHKLNEVDEENQRVFKDKITFVNIDNEIPFQDTIAILQNIDLLITIDTFIVHLAGVLNIKTLLLLGYVTDWRWFNDNSICDWYNSVEILRMKENKELKYILTDVKDKLTYI
jgi:tetratricopeptide (TPR) repeat protein